MLRRTIVAALAAVLLVGCGTTDVTLGQWVQQSGLAKTMQQLSVTVAAMGSDLAGVNQQDPKAVAWVLVQHGKAITQEARALAAEPKSSDEAFEKVRTDTANAMLAYAEAVTAITTAKSSEMLAVVGRASTSLTAVTASITALSNYLTAHASDPVHAA